VQLAHTKKSIGVRSTVHICFKPSRFLNNAKLESELLTVHITLSLCIFAVRVPDPGPVPIFFSQ
jgi:hypothetical protein